MKIKITTIREMKKESFPIYIKMLKDMHMPRHLISDLIQTGRGAWKHPEFDGGIVESIYEIIEK